MPEEYTRYSRFLAAVLWIAAVAVGLGMLARYEGTPGVSREQVKWWPEGSRLKRATDRATLVMAAHPQCPCTRASLDDLDGLMAHAGGKVKVVVLALKPEELTDEWADTALTRRASAIPGVDVVRDENGTEAQLFGMDTSGHVLLYAADGRLLFSGGITAARGHSGANAGSAAILSLLNGGKPATDHTPVFGCSLF